MTKLSELKLSARRKILLYGNSGTGKTVFGCSFPGPIYVADFDGKISSAAEYYNKDSERLEDIDYDTFLPKDPKDLVFRNFYNKLAEIKAVGKSGELKYKTFVLDSLTTYAEAMMVEVMAQNPGIKCLGQGATTAPALQHYRLLNNHFKNVLNEILSLPCNVVITAHIKTDKDELTGEIVREPMLSGQLAARLPIMFEEVYRTYTDGSGTGIKYLAQTQSDRSYKCRSQISGLPNPLVLNYKEYEKYAVPKQS